MSSRIRVWDLPTRIFHWALAACVIGLLATGYIGGGLMNWHFRLGYSVAALLAFRLIWGFVGGRWSRFSSFIHSPAALIKHLGGRGDAASDAGHSPTGALSVFGLLLILLLQVLSGMSSDDAITFTGPLAPLLSGNLVSLATDYHKDIGQWIVLALVILHVLAILFYAVWKKKNLTAAMITGDKSFTDVLPASRDTAATRVAALLVFLICCAAVWGFLEWANV